MKKLYIFCVLAFSFPLIGAPNSFIVACDNVVYATWDTKSKKTVRDSFKDKYVFEFVSNPSGKNDYGSPQDPYIQYFGKIPKTPLENTIWFDNAIDYVKSTETIHFFQNGMGYSKQTLTINRETLEITTRGVDIDYGRAVDMSEAKRIETKGFFTSCEIIDVNQLDILVDLLLEDYRNFEKELEEKEKKRKAEVKSKQKI